MKNLGIKIKLSEIETNKIYNFVLSENDVKRLFNNELKKGDFLLVDRGVDMEWMKIIGFYDSILSKQEKMHNRLVYGKMVSMR